MQPLTLGLGLGLTASLALNGVLAAMLLLGPRESSEVSRAELPEVVAELEETERPAIPVAESDSFQVPPFDKMTMAWYVALPEEHRREFWLAMIKTDAILDATLIDPAERRDVAEWLMTNADLLIASIKNLPVERPADETVSFAPTVPMMLKAVRAANEHPSIIALNKSLNGGR